MTEPHEHNWVVSKEENNIIAWCSWNWEQSGYDLDLPCKEILSEAEINRRLNAGERLSEKRVNEILEDRTVTTGDVMALRAYVAEREKKG